MKRTVWMFVAYLVAIMSVLVACGGAATTTSTGTTVTATATTTTPKTTTPATTTTTTTTTTAGAEKPQYGGTYVISLSTDIPYFDDTVGALAYCTTLYSTQERLLQGDWSRGPAGTGEADWLLPGANRLDLKTGALADSWQIPQQGTIIFHIRKGVHWQNTPPTDARNLVGGREMTVDDVVFSLNRAFTTKGSYFSTAYAGMSKSAVVTSDKTAGTVTVTCPVSEWVNLINLVPEYLTIVPPEVVNKYGNMQDWRNSVGTGPFVLTDFVSNGSATYARNPNYWMTNPVGPGKGDQLPYVDGVRLLIIPDASTQASAFRTGKLDILSGTSINRLLAGTILDDKTLKISSKRYIYDGCYLMAMRTDMPSSPFSNKDVRQAVMLALNLKTIKNSYYGGDSELVGWPIAPPPKEYQNLYVPLDQLPANVQALYNGPDVAASTALLTKAGYPNGFSVNVWTYNTPVFIDILSSFKADLAKVNINMTINGTDYASWVARFSARNYGANDFLWTSTAGIGTYQRMINFRGSGTYNSSYINDATVEAAYQQMQQYVGVDEAKCQQINHDLMPYLLEQAYVIPVPVAYLYMIWWPWLKNYYGVQSVGYYESFGKYIWIDQALRKQMTGR